VANQAANESLQSQLADLRAQLEQRDIVAADEATAAKAEAETAKQSLVDVQASLHEAQAQLRQLEDQCKRKDAELQDAEEVSASSQAKVTLTHTAGFRLRQ
jgi:chromosome segregation ATPase